MAKHAKKHDTKIINLKDYQKKLEQDAYGEDGQPVAEYEFVDEEQESAEAGEAARREEQKGLPKAVYHISLVLLLVLIGLSLWVNREYLNWDTMKEWARVQVFGDGSGDGFPVQLTGANVAGSNFISYGGSAVVLSNTALTVISADGQEEMSQRHDLNQPVLRAAGGKYLIYNSGSKGYTLFSGGKVAVSGVAGQDIITGCVAQNGRFALGMEGNYGASRLEVYMKDGSLQYEYPFASEYITAAALNYDGSMGVVCTVRSEKGEMVSKLTIFDFSKEEPVTQYETRDNLLLDVCWNENGVIYGVGDGALVAGKSSDYQFTEYYYQGRQLTAYYLGSGRAFLSISSYELAGPSTLLAYNGNEAFSESNPVRIELDKRIEAISTSGGTVGMLAGGEAIFCDWATGMELGRASAGEDAKSIALGSESRAYVLGVSDLRVVEVS